jgi:hypothetical protein
VTTFGEEKMRKWNLIFAGLILAMTVLAIIALLEAL